MKTQIKIIFLIHDFLMFQKSDVPNSDKSKKFNFQSYIESWKQHNLCSIRSLFVRSMHIVPFFNVPGVYSGPSTVFKFVRDLCVFDDTNCTQIHNWYQKFLNHESIQCEPCNVRVRHSKVFSRTLLTYWNLGWASSYNFKQAKKNVILMIRHQV